MNIFRKGDNPGSFFIEPVGLAVVLFLSVFSFILYLNYFHYTVDYSRESDSVDAQLAAVGMTALFAEGTSTINSAIGTSSVPTVPVYVFTRDLEAGSKGTDVFELQKYLNENRFVISPDGPGSPGNETTYFGRATRIALTKFQKTSMIKPAAGYFGPKTRNIINANIAATALPVVVSGGGGGAGNTSQLMRPATQIPASTVMRSPEATSLTQSNTTLATPPAIPLPPPVMRGVSFAQSASSGGGGGGGGGSSSVPASVSLPSAAVPASTPSSASESTPTPPTTTVSSSAAAAATIPPVATQSPQSSVSTAAATTTSTSTVPSKTATTSIAKVPVVATSTATSTPVTSSTSTPKQTSALVAKTVSTSTATSTPALVVPTSTPASTSSVATTSSVRNNYGIAAGGGLTALSQGALDAYFTMLNVLGITWVRWDMNWVTVQPNNATSYNWQGPDRVVAAALKYGINSLAIITYTPVWARSSACVGSDKCAPKDPAQFAAFAAQVAARYKAQGLHYWEIWNEPNTAGFWAVKADCNAYTALLKASYSAIKQTDSSATVITGGTAPAATDGTNVSPVDFLACIYKNGGKDYFDAVADHPYTFPQFPSAPVPHAWAQMSTTPTNLRSLMIANGDSGKKIWMTEFGAPTNGPDPRWYVSESKQAQMITDAFQLYKTYSWAGPIFLYSLKDSGTSANTSENFFGLLRYDGSHKPAYDTLKSVISPGI